MIQGMSDWAILILALLWAVPWKAVALWKAARNKQIAWFIALILINTLGALEILYIAFFQRDQN